MATTGKDAALTQSVLQHAGVVCQSCRDFDQLCLELDSGAGVLMIVEEAISSDGGGGVKHWLSRQPAWSDLPILVLALPGADSAAVGRSMDLLGNVTVLERPIRVAALVSAVRSALRARTRQYQIRDHLVERELADRRKDEFLAILAHELRNPLAPIRNSLHILRVTSQHDSAVARLCEMMERQVNQMVRLVDDLLEISRITRGTIDLRQEPVEVAAIIRGAVETSLPLIEAGGHQLELSIPEEPITLTGDRVRLTQVAANLLNNAAKYTDEGGRICVSVCRDGDDVMIRVADNGAGIASDMLPRIFDIFTQVERRIDRAQGGLGIGLTLVKRLVEMHGGTVEARSDGRGRGSEFVVRLPVADAPRPVGPDEPKSTTKSALTNWRVLVVDDNRDAADSMSMLLNLLGADVHTVYSGSDALEAFSRYQPTVVLLDIGMPGMDGYEVARRIRVQPVSRAVTLIALTGWGQDMDRKRSELAGFDDHLVKPADIGALETLLTSQDTRSRSRR